MTKSSDPHRELFVLGVVRRKAASAYDVDRILRDHVPLYRRFSHGNVYRFVERLAEDGLLAGGRAAVRRGPRETKIVYKLTPAGDARFRELLRLVLCDVQQSDAALETALVLLGQVRRDEALELVMERTREVENQERRLGRFFGDARKRGGAGYFAAAHAYHRMQSERRFLQDVVTLLRDAKWEPDWISDDGPITDPARRL